MIVTAVEAAAFRLPRELWWGDLPVGGSLYSIPYLELVTCRIRTDGGVDGMGLTYTVGQGGRAVHSLLEHELRDELLGLDVDRVDAFWGRAGLKLGWVGGAGVVPCAIAAADIALWDARAKAAGQPLYAYLGAHREAISTYGSGVNLEYSLEQLLAEIDASLERGLDAVKIKVGRDRRDDVERVAAVRERIGPDRRLMVDANMAWDLREASLRVQAFAPYDVSWLEEPLAAEDIAGYAALQRSSPIAIAAGETIFSQWRFREFLERDALRIAQPDVARLGVTGWLRVARLAEAFHVVVAPHFVHDIHVHLACAIPNALCLEYLPWFDRIVEGSLELRDGAARPRQGPGHGMVLRDDLIAPHRVA